MGSDDEIADDIYDIYEDVEEFDLGKTIEKLNLENKQLQDFIDLQETTINNLKDELVEIKNQNDKLSENMSSLYLTARSEIERKDSTIAELRKQLDDVKFRRNKGYSVKDRQQAHNKDDCLLVTEKNNQEPSSTIIIIESEEQILPKVEKVSESQLKESEVKNSNRYKHNNRGYTCDEYEDDAGKFNRYRNLDRNQNNSKDNRHLYDRNRPDLRDRLKFNRERSNNRKEDNKDRYGTKSEDEFSRRRDPRRNNSLRERERNNSSHERERNSTLHGRDRNKSLHERERNNSPHARERNNSPYERDRNNSSHERERNSNIQERGRNKSIHERERNKSPCEREQNNSPYERERNKSSSERERNNSPYERERNNSPHERYRNKSLHERDRNNSSHERERNNSSNVRERNNNFNERGRNNSSHDRERNNNFHEREWNNRSRERDRNIIYYERERNNSSHERGRNEGNDVYDKRSDNNYARDILRKEDKSRSKSYTPPNEESTEFESRYKESRNRSSTTAFDKTNSNRREETNETGTENKKIMSRRKSTADLMYHLFEDHEDEDRNSIATEKESNNLKMDETEVESTNTHNVSKNYDDNEEDILNDILEGWDEFELEKEIEMKQKELDSLNNSTEKEIEIKQKEPDSLNSSSESVKCSSEDNCKNQGTTMVSIALDSNNIENLNVLKSGDKKKVNSSNDHMIENTKLEEEAAAVVSILPDNVDINQLEVSKIKSNDCLVKDKAFKQDPADVNKSKKIDVLKSNKKKKETSSDDKKQDATVISVLLDDTKTEPESKKRKTENSSSDHLFEDLKLDEKKKTVDSNNSNEKLDASSTTERKQDNSTNDHIVQEQDVAVISIVSDNTTREKLGEPKSNKRKIESCMKFEEEDEIQKSTKRKKEDSLNDQVIEDKKLVQPRKKKKLSSPTSILLENLSNEDTEIKSNLNIKEKLDLETPILNSCESIKPTLTEDINVNNTTNDTDGKIVIVSDVLLSSVDNKTVENDYNNKRIQTNNTESKNINIKKLQSIKKKTIINEDKKTYINNNDDLNREENNKINKEKSDNTKNMKIDKLQMCNDEKNVNLLKTSFEDELSKCDNVTTASKNHNKKSTKIVVNKNKLKTDTRQINRRRSTRNKSVQKINDNEHTNENKIEICRNKSTKINFITDVKDTESISLNKENTTEICVDKKSDKLPEEIKVSDKSETVSVNISNKKQDSSKNNSISDTKEKFNDFKYPNEVDTVIDSNPNKESSLQLTNEASPTSNIPKTRKRITPTPVKDTPVCSFKNILERNNSQMKVFSMQPTLNLTDDGEIPVLHLEDNSFNNMEDTTQKTVDKSIIKLLDCMNVSNLDCEIPKLNDKIEEVPKSNLTFQNIIHTVSEDNKVADVNMNTTPILTSTPKKDTNLPLISLPESIQENTKEHKTVIEESKNVLSKEENNVVNNETSKEAPSKPVRFRRRCRMIAIRKV